MLLFAGSCLAAVLWRVVLHTKIMSEFVCNGESERQTRVLVDVAATMRLTHSRHLRQAERATRLIHPRTDVCPGQQNGNVMAIRMLVCARVDTILPLTEAGQRVVGVVSDL
jgi:hypothetical protein